MPVVGSGIKLVLISNQWWTVDIISISSEVSGDNNSNNGGPLGVCPVSASFEIVGIDRSAQL